MKKFIYYFLLMIFLGQLCLSQKFEFTPININFTSIESKGDTIAVLGDFGSMLISYDNAETWQQKRVFDKGKMVKVFFKDNQMLAFSDVGQISISNDDGKTWELTAELNDSVLAVIRYPEGYFLKSDHNLFIISNDFVFKKEFSLATKPLGNYFNFQYTKSLAYLKNTLIAAIDSARFIRFDSQLTVIDTILFAKLGLGLSSYGNYKIDYDSNYFYTKVGSIIYKTQDFTLAEIAYDGYDYYKLINGKIYYLSFPFNYLPQHENFKLSLYQVINKDSSKKISEFDYSFVTAHIYPKDFTITNNKLILIGDSKLIITFNLIDSTANVVSDFSGGNYYNLPDRLNDSTYLFYCGFYYGLYYNEVYRTENNGLTFKPTIDTKINPNYRDYFAMEFKYYDAYYNILYFCGSYDLASKSIALISKDYGKSFTYKEMPDNHFYSASVRYPKFRNTPNLFKRADNLILPSNSIIKKKASTKILTYNKEFDLISEYRDSNYVINYVYSSDTNTFVIHCINFIDTTREFRYTSDKGLTWELIKKYPDADSMLYYKEITIDNKPALAMFLYNHLDSFVTIEILDFDSRVINKIYYYKVPELSYEKLINNGIFRDSNYIYIAIQNTLFFTKDIYDSSKWKYINFPNNGKIIETCKKYGDTFFARYSDDIHPNNIYWIRITDMDKPKPMISAYDFDFGKHDIKSNDTISEILKIENPSQEANLIITGYSNLTGSVFTANLPQIDSLNSLEIKPGEYFEYEVIFRPKETIEYRDSIVFYSNAQGLDNNSYLTGEGIDTITTVINVEIEIQNYLYAYPPYPLPAMKEVRSLIYWDLINDIDKDEIAVYNVYGEKVCGREKINIDKQTMYSGFLIWDCSNFESGIYFIQIKHGTRTLTLKTMVDR